MTFLIVSERNNYLKNFIAVLICVEQIEWVTSLRFFLERSTFAFIVLIGVFSSFSGCANLVVPALFADFRTKSFLIVNTTTRVVK